MKRRDLIKGCQNITGQFEFVREGANHTVYRVGNKIIPVPRHREINERTAAGIIATVTHAATEEV